MSIEDFVRQMIEVLPQMGRGIALYEHNYLTKGEITLPQFWVLNYLASKKTAKMSELAKYLGTTRPATTGLVDRLILQKLVMRRDDADDRRIVWIELTAKGSAIIHNIREQKIRTMSKVFSQISTQDRSHYLNITRQVVRVIDTLTQGKKDKGG